MPKLIRLYIVSVAIGFAISAVFAVLLIAFDVAHLRRLVFGSDVGWLAAALIVFFNGIVFAGVQFAIAVMRLAEPEDRGPRGPMRRVRPVHGAPVPVKVAVPGASGGGNRSNRGGVSFPRA